MSESTVTGQSLQSAGVIPDLLSLSYATSTLQLLPIFYGGSSTSIVPNSILTPTATKDQPRISLPPGLPSDALYTILCFDADPPSRRRPRFRSALHQAQVNIPYPAASDVTGAGVSPAPYYPPGPPTGSGLHRYIFLLYQQSGAIDASQLPSFDGFDNRAKRKEEEFVASLKALGGGNMTLLAINWFQAEWDEEVDRAGRARFGILYWPMSCLIRLFI